MSCMSQNFRLFLVSNLSVQNFRIFLLMYPRSQTGLYVRLCPDDGLQGRGEEEGGEGGRSQNTLVVTLARPNAEYEFRIALQWRP